MQQVSCGDSHTIAIAMNLERRDSKRSVYTWGNGRFGRLGHGDEEKCRTPRIVKDLEPYGNYVTGVSAGGSFSLVLVDTEESESSESVSQRDRNVLFAFGNGRDGQLGLSMDFQGKRLTPSRVHNRDVTQNQRLIFKYVSAGQKHALAVVRTGKKTIELYGWGCNVSGQLGLGDFMSRGSPTLVRSFSKRNLALDRGQIFLRGLFPKSFERIGPKFQIIAGSCTSYAITYTQKGY